MCINECCVPWCAFDSKNEATKRRQGICACHEKEEAMQKVIECEKCGGLVFYAVEKQDAVSLQCRGCQTSKVFLIHRVGMQKAWPGDHRLPG